jgi:hypothetical protein
MPSFMSSKRARMMTVAAAGTLTLAAAVTVALAILPASAAAAPAAALVTADAGHPHQVRTGHGERQHDHQFAPAKKVTARAATTRAAAAKQAAAARTATARKKAATKPSGTPEQIARQMLGRYGWSDSEFSCLQPLWYHESDWDPSADNPNSGAYGIPQALPGAQMASAGADWQTNPATQIKWGLDYIHGRYGSPCGAWAHEQADNWY